MTLNKPSQSPSDLGRASAQRATRLQPRRSTIIPRLFSRAMLLKLGVEPEMRKYSSRRSDEFAHGPGRRRAGSSEPTKVSNLSSFPGHAEERQKQKEAPIQRPICAS